MSNPLAIAAVTATLRNLLQTGLVLDPELADATVSMQPLDRARTNGNNANQLNIFLYHVLPSATWRNTNIPGQVRSGETGFPPLGLNLYYLLTAFGQNNDTQRPFSHRLMGRAMSILNDHPLLGADEIKAALQDNDLWMQIERVRLTLQPFSVEEVAKLWTGFQTQYRLSVAYEAAVVLIESQRTVAAALPVLTRGKDDSGILAQANMVSPLPTITSVELPNQQSTCNLGDVLTLTGVHLDGDQVNVRFSNPRLDPPLLVPVNAGGTDTQVTVTVPNKPASVPAGVYVASAVITIKGEGDRESNGVPVAIAPKITTKLPITVKHGKTTTPINLTCSPHVLPEQRVSLLLGSQEVPSAARAKLTNQLTFAAPTPETVTYPITYPVRLRVDGVDSQLLVRSKTPPVFDPTQLITIQ